MDQKSYLTKLFDSTQIELLLKLIPTLTKDQQIWLAGYLSGLSESKATVLGNDLNTETEEDSVQSGNGETELTILYGTRSGNAEEVAEWAERKATNLGIKTNLIDLMDYNPKDIKKEKNVLVIVSTDGEGEPPVSAEDFYNHLHSSKVPRLDGLNFAVIGLGDITYQYFCKAGKDIYKKLKELGGHPFARRLDCDIDYEDPSNDWLDENLALFIKGSNEKQSSIVISEVAKVFSTEFNKEKPFQAFVQDKILLNGKGSSKETYHYEFSIEESGLKYNPGDALGVLGVNSKELVDKVLLKSKLDESDKLLIGNEQKTIREALTNHFEIARITPPLLKAYAGIAKSIALDKIINDQASFEKYLWGRDLLDLFDEYPVDLDKDQLFNMLTKLHPRLYSIASSYKANPDEVHITVATVKYNNNDRLRKGVCSTYLSEFINDGAEVPIYIDENKGFRLPSDPSTPIIMIGAGTGVAPYRAFLQERELVSNPGKSWLFFGDRNFTTDFLYQTEWLKYKKKGTLTNIDLAFSRDQNEKVYVQHKLLANKKKIYNWLEEGAHVYICGDKNNMAKDVKSSLLEVVKKSGNLKNDQAEEYLKQLRKQNRLQEDVY